MNEPAPPIGVICAQRTNANEATLIELSRTHRHWDASCPAGQMSSQRSDLHVRVGLGVVVLLVAISAGARWYATHDVEPADEPRPAAGARQAPAGLAEKIHEQEVGARPRYGCDHPARKPAAERPIPGGCGPIRNRLEEALR